VVALGHGPSLRFPRPKPQFPAEESDPVGKRLPKKELLIEINAEIAKLRELISDLRPRQMTSLPVTEAGWTVKDIFGHLVGWHRLQRKWHQAELDGKVPVLPDEGFSWKQTPELNQQIYRTFKKVSLKNVMAEFEEGHQWILDQIDQFSDRQLTKLEQFAWTGKSWTISDYLRANSASHYRWASKHLRRWKKSLK